MSFLEIIENSQNQIPVKIFSFLDFADLTALLGSHNVIHECLKDRAFDIIVPILKKSTTIEKTTTTEMICDRFLKEQAYYEKNKHHEKLHDLKCLVLFYAQNLKIWNLMLLRKHANKLIDNFTVSCSMQGRLLIRPYLMVDLIAENRCFHMMVQAAKDCYIHLCVITKNIVVSQKDKNSCLCHMRTRTIVSYLDDRFF